MRAQATDSLAAWPADLTPPNGVLVLSGYGLDVRVWRGRLRVADGIGHERREALVHRATGRLRRLVVLGHTGAITLEAIRWLADLGAGYVQIDADGRVLAAFGPQGTDRPGLRRAQARALDTPAGDDIARRLIAEKVAAQAETLAAVDRSVAVSDEVVAAMRSAAARVHLAANRDELRLAEALAAAAYWSAWAPIAVRFARRDTDRVPAHWRTFGTRTSALTGSPRLATNPANAVLGYLYALLEGEATLAARVVGLDPGLGVLHADQLNRDSLAADLMEPERPLVDRYLLRLLQARAFAAADFYETRQGVCRVTPPLARELIATLPEWRRAVGRVAEDVARLLESPSPAPRATPTPISGRNRSRGRGVSARVAPTGRPSPVAASCTQCGGPTDAGRRTCSEACRVEAEDAAAELFRAGGPPMTDGGRDRLSAKSTDLIHRAREWQRVNGMRKPEEFREAIYPLLEDVSIRELVRRTGLSLAYCRKIKRGLVVPHPMWWERLELGEMKRRSPIALGGSTVPT
jgi:CRISPR-associated endonuclease Cas1